MSNSFKLSICMMVKDEENNLKRCLDALKPLLEKPDIELIIVDTGSKDQSINIASQYTSKVYFHPWNNHFSDMRNITISYAKGDRIFILDADEVLVNAEELYEIISDERLASFNTLILKIKNFIGANQDYTLLPQERIFRNDGDFMYEGTVHNQPKFKPPVLDTDIYVDHYGYMSNDLELQERKFKRTGALLKEELTKNPNSIYYRYQMAKSFDAHRDHKDALKEIRTAYGLIRDDKKKKIYIFGEYALICMKNAEYEEAIKVCREGIEIEPEYIDLYYMMAESMQKLSRYQAALEAYKAYIKWREKYGTLAISSNRSIEMLFMSDSSYDVALTFIIKELFRQSRYDKALEYAYLVCEQSIKSAFLFHIFLKFKNHNELKALYMQSISNISINELLIALIEEERNNLNQIDRRELDTLFSTFGDMYSLLNIIRIKEAENNQPFVEQIMKQADYNEIPDFYADMFLGLDKNPRILFSYLKRLQKSKIKSFVKKLIESKNELKNVFVEYLMKEKVRENDFNSIKLFIGVASAILFYEAGLLNKDSPIIPENNSLIFSSYVDAGIKYINLLYNTQRLRLYYNTLENQEDRFFIALSYAKESVVKGEYSSGIRYYGEAVRTNPYMSCYMNEYKNKLFSKIDTEEKGD